MGSLPGVEAGRPLMTGADHGETLAPLFDGLAKRGNQPAVLQFERDGRNQLTYSELAAGISRLAAGLREAGICSGECLLLFGSTSPAWIVVCLAAIRAGAVPVPLDTQVSEDNLARIVDNSGAQWAVVDEQLLPRLDASGFDGTHRLLDAEAGEAHGWRDWCRETGAELPELRADDTALLFYTSGTTGPPKGVPLRHRQLAFQLDALGAAGLIRPDDRMLQPLPGHHVYPLVIGTLAPLALGLTLVLPRSLTGPELLRAIREAEVSIILGVPRLYAALYQGIERQLASGGRLRAGAGRMLLRACTWLRRRLRLQVGKYVLAPLHRRVGGRLRVLASGGSPLDPDLAWRLEGLGWQTAIGYGLTETSPLLTLNPPSGNHPESVGRALPGVDIRIDPGAHPAAEDGAGGAAGTDDADWAGPDRPGVEGEILARGAGVFDGYLGLEEKTEEAFSGEWFRTGDLGCFDASGRLYVSGRRSTLIVTAAGENAPPDEIESVYERHEAIEEAGVLLDDGELVAVIVPARAVGDAEDREDAIHAAVKACGKRLPSHQRVARFELDGEPLERTRLGKIRRHRLEARYRALQSGEADDESAPAEPAAVDELSPRDRQLLEDARARQTWEVLVDTYADRPVRPGADLRLDLGIDSLGWLDRTVELAQRAGVELDEEKIAELESVRDLLVAVTGLEDAEDFDPQAPLHDPASVLSEDQQRWLQALSPAAASCAALLQRLNRGGMLGWFDLEVGGSRSLPETQPMVVAPNHASYLDPFAVAAALPMDALQRIYWGGWTGAAFRNRLLRAFSRLARAVPVDPDRAVVSSLAFASAVMKRGDGLVWFPEGERSVDGELGEFRPGLGMLLEHYPDVPVVPTCIAGSHQAWPPDRRFPHRHRVGVTFGAPITGQELEQRGSGDEPRQRITAALRNEVAALQPPWSSR